MARVLNSALKVTPLEFRIILSLYLDRDWVILKVTPLEFRITRFIWEYEPQKG